MYFGPGSTGKRHEAQYMGVYGPLVQREMLQAGDTRSILVNIGSPRFDVYSHLQNSKQSADGVGGTRFVVLCVSPIVYPEESTDSWDVVDYFQTSAAAARTIPNAHVIIKLRPGPNRNAFLAATIGNLFKDISHTVAQFEPLSELYPQADVVISGYSTAALEALQCGIPLVYLGLCPVEQMTGMHHFKTYADTGVMRICTSKEDLSNTLGELVHDPDVRQQQNAISFLEREYAFDGKAAERAAAFIEKVAQK
jgi:hypothetical protein